MSEDLIRKTAEEIWNKIGVGPDCQDEIVIILREKLGPAMRDHEAMERMRQHRIGVEWTENCENEGEVPGWQAYLPDGTDFYTYFGGRHAKPEDAAIEAGAILAARKEAT
jgi:hypothetical protein